MYWNESSVQTNVVELRAQKEILICRVNLDKGAKKIIEYVSIADVRKNEITKK